MIWNKHKNLEILKKTEMVMKMKHKIGQIKRSVGRVEDRASRY